MELRSDAGFFLEVLVFQIRFQGVMFLLSELVFSTTFLNCGIDKSVALTHVPLDVWLVLVNSFSLQNVENNLWRWCY